MRHGLKVNILGLCGAVLATVITVGCASAPPLRTERTTSEIRAAEEAGASQVPRAALHLQLANEQLEGAKALNERGDKAQATSMLTRAEADARLAVLLSREDAEKLQAQAAVERVRQLRQDNDRSDTTLKEGNL